MKKSKNLNTGVMGNTVKDHLRTAYNVNATARLIADWNWNRYANPTATNTPSENTDGFEIEAFPIESIVEPLRPSKGATKALVGQAVVAPGYINPHDPRFYTSDRDDTYKYWSHGPSDETGVISGVKPRVTYDRVVKANKIVIKFENTWATPDDWGVQVASTLTDGVATGFQAEIPGSSININDNGEAVLYYNGTAWVTATNWNADDKYVDHPPVFSPRNVSGIQVNVRSLTSGIRRDGEVMGYFTDGNESSWQGTTGANSNFNLIAIEAHLEADLSDRLITVNDTFDFAEKSWLYPIGTITTNVAEITLANEDGIFNAENDDVTNPYVGLIEPNCEFDLKYIFEIDGVEHSVQQFKMYASQWSPGDGEVSVSLEDYSKYLKEIKPRAFMVEGKSSQELVWRVLDSVGFVDYGIQQEDLVDDSVVPVFWTDGEMTVWEILDELAQGTQTAIYFNESGRLQVRTRAAAYKEDETIDWNLLGIKDGANLPDIVSWSPSAEYEANKIEVKYQNAKWKVNSQGNPAMAKVWEPDGESLVVRSTALRQSFDADDELFYIDQKDIAIWPFEGMVQIDGEVLRYEGKQFVYFTYTTTYDPITGAPTHTNEVRNTAIVNNTWEMRKKNRLTPPKRRHKNHYTGGFKVKKRGLFNTEPSVHSVDLSGWDAKVELDMREGGTIKDNPAGLKHLKKESLLNINTPPSMKDENDIFWATRGGAQSTGYKVYGTRLRFDEDKASSTQVAGMCFNLSGARENGYYFEIRLSSSLDAKKRAVSSEVVTYSRINGTFKKLDRGSATAIGRGIWYDVDIYKTESGGQHVLTVFVNGHRVSSVTTTGTTKHANNGQFGLYARGKTNVQFEYAYAVAFDDIKEPIDNYGFYDLKYGGVRGNQWLKEYVWRTKERSGKLMERDSEKERVKRRNKYVFDEFGPYVHEVRKFDVKFDPVPVRYSYLFNTNEWYSTVVQYNGDPMGAKFIIANTSRENAILHGEDNLIYAGASSGVNQVCVVLGQVLELAEEETITRKNKPSILARGEINVELANRWIQSKDMARDLAQWMCEHWSESIDQVDVEVFGNPLIELGDLVNVNFPRADVLPETHEYWVTAVSTSFDNGITTNLTLRRRRIAIDVEDE